MTYFELHGLNDASDQIISKSHLIFNMDINEINNKNDNVFFVLYNCLNDYFMALKKNNDYYIY